jgi:DNA-binding response OmpR family regulator
VLKEEILDAIWGPDYRDATDYLRVWIPLLRRRLGPGAAQSIKTVRGLGYIVELPAAEPGAGRSTERRASPQRTEGSR